MKKSNIMMLAVGVMLSLSSCQNLLGGIQLSSGEEISSEEISRNEISSEEISRNEISSEEGYKLPETNNYSAFVNLINKDIEDGKEIPYLSFEKKFGEAHYTAEIQFGFSESIWFIGESSKVEWLKDQLNSLHIELGDIPSGYVEMVIVIYNDVGIVLGSSYEIFDFEENFGNMTDEPSNIPSVEIIPSVESTESEPSFTEEYMSVGLGYSSFFDEERGQLDLTAAFVAFDEEGMIVDTRIDVVQIKVEKNGNGNLQIKGSGTALNEDGSIQTKLELGKNHCMEQSSPIGKEIDKQIEAFSDWTIGQTVEDVVNKVDPSLGHGVAHHPELESSVTILCNDFVTAIKMAWENKTETTYEKTGHAGIAMLAGLNEGFGYWEMYADIGGVMASDGVVYASQIDAIVLQIIVDEEGYIRIIESQKYIDSDGNLLSKKTLNDRYGMQLASPIGTEWYEQAKVIEDATICKSVVEILALQAGEGDLAGATLKLNNYLSVIAKATQYSELEHIGPQA